MAWHSLLVLGVFGLAAMGQQIPSTTPPVQTPAGRVITLPTDASTVNVPLGPTASSASVKGDQAAVPAEIKAQLQQFQAARDSYLKKQKELTQQLKGSSDEQRRLVREQLHVLRQEWLDRSLAFRREVSDRLPPDLRGFGVLESKKAVSTDLRRDNRNLK